MDTYGFISASISTRQFCHLQLRELRMDQVVAVIPDLFPISGLLTLLIERFLTFAYWIRQFRQTKARQQEPSYALIKLVDKLIVTVVTDSSQNIVHAENL